MPSETLVAQFAGAGLNGPEVMAIDILTAFAIFEDYWQPFLGGQGPAPAYAMSLDETTRTSAGPYTSAHPRAGRRLDFVDRTGLGSPRNCCKVSRVHKPGQRALVASAASRGRRR